jgi:tetratricopeptide (TPR) repeat protein
VLRIYLLAVLELALVVVDSTADPKPPWQRLLTGGDAQKAAELAKRIAALAAADQYAQAIHLAEELLALRMRLQGADHLETVNQHWDVQALKRIAALPVEKRAGWRKAEQRAAEAQRLNQKAQYVKAAQLWEEQLNWCRQVLGEDHPDTATSYNYVALNLAGQGKYAEAGLLNQKALAIRRKALGEDHPDTAQSYNNLALNLDDQGRSSEAAPLYQKALDIKRKILGEDHPRTVLSYHNLASNLYDQGRFAEAGPLYLKALDIKRQALGEDHEQTADGYSGLAVNLDAQGKCTEAGPLHQKALDIRRKILGEDHPVTAIGYGNVGYNLNAQEKYTEAAAFYQKALDIFDKALGTDHPYTARSCNNVAYNLSALGKYAEAAALYQKVLALRRKALGEDHLDTAASYNNLAANLQAQGHYVEAGPLFQKALDVHRRALGEYHPTMAQSYNNVAYNLQAQGKYAPALASLEAAARSYEAARLAVAAGLQRATFGAEHSPYNFLALARNRAGRAADAWVALEANLARGLLDELANRRGRSLTPAEERQRAEWQSRRTGLEGRVLTLGSQAQRTAAESAELQRLIRQRQEVDASLGDLAAAMSRREVATLAQLQTVLPADAAWIAWADVSDKAGVVEEHWGCVIRPQGNPCWERLRAAGPGGKWTKKDSGLPAQLRAALRSAPAEEIESLALQLRAQRLEPLQKHLAGVKQLYVVPVGLIAGVPVEVLTDQYTVSYTPSGTYLARLPARRKPRSTRLLAVGDPVFRPVQALPPPTALPPGGLLITQVVPDGNAAQARLQAGDVLVAYAGQELSSVEELGKVVAAQANAKSVVVKVWREREEKLNERTLLPGKLGVVLAKEPAREAISARWQADQMLAMLTRGEGFAELPGTQVEIARLAGLFEPGSVTTLTRADAGEQRLEALRRAGALEQFRYLHLATHGKANNVRSFDSALLLTRPDQLPEPRVGEPYLDGRLTAAEVLEYWQLDADLARISQMARSFRHGVCAFSLEIPAFPILSCRNDRGTQWVTATMTPCVLISTGKSSWSSTARPSPVTPGSLPIGNSTTPSD